MTPRGHPWTGPIRLGAFLLMLLAVTAAPKLFPVLPIAIGLITFGITQYLNRQYARTQPPASPTPAAPAVRLSGLVGWILLLVLTVIVADVSKSWLLGWFSYIMAGLILLGMLITFRPARLLSVSRRLYAGCAEIGEGISVEVSLSWDRPNAPGWVLVHDQLPDGLRALMPCGRMFVSGMTSSVEFTYRVAGDRRGYYPIGPLRLASGDLFGMTEAQLTDEARDFLVVYPRVRALPAPCLPSNRPIGGVRSPKRIFEDPSRTAGIRDYAPGDPLSRIHWKTTARTGVLATKISEPTSTVEINLILNLCAGDYPDADTVELACTTAASVTANLLDGRLEVGLQSNGDDAAHLCNPKIAPVTRVKEDNGPRQLTDILSLLGRLVPAPNLPFADYLTRVHSSLPWTATILVITPALDEASAVALQGLTRAGFELALIIIGEGDGVDAAKTRAAALNVPIALIVTEQHLGHFEFWRPGSA